MGPQVGLLKARWVDTARWVDLQSTQHDGPYPEMMVMRAVVLGAWEVQLCSTGFHVKAAWLLASSVSVLNKEEEAKNKAAMLPPAWLL